MDQLELTREVFDNRERDQKIDFLTKDNEVKESVIKSLLSQLEDQKDENQNEKLKLFDGLINGLSSGQSIQVTDRFSKIERNKKSLITYIFRKNWIK